MVDGAADERQSPSAHHICCRPVQLRTSPHSARVTWPIARRSRQRCRMRLRSATKRTGCVMGIAPPITAVSKRDTSHQGNRVSVTASFTSAGTTPRTTKGTAAPASSAGSSAKAIASIGTSHEPRTRRRARDATEWVAAKAEPPSPRTTSSRPAQVTIMAIKGPIT